MKSAQKKPKEASVKWIDMNRKILITSLLKFSNGPITNLNNSKSGWSKVVADFHEKTNLSYNKDKLTHVLIMVKMGPFIEISDNVAPPCF